MPLTLKLRPAVEQDVDALVGIARRAWLSAFAEHAPSPLIAYWRTANREPDWYRRFWADMIVAEQAGTAVGLTQPAADEVNGLWVTPEWQGRGIGRLLLRAAERRISEAGHNRAWLTCSGFNRRAARFYRACGYQLEREVVQQHLSGVTETVHVFARQLDASAT